MFGWNKGLHEHRLPISCTRERLTSRLQPPIPFVLGLYRGAKLEYPVNRPTYHFDAYGFADFDG